MNENINWNEEMTKQEINEIEKQLVTDPELDARMNPAWTSTIDDIWRRFNVLNAICINAEDDELEYLLWLIDSINADMCMWSNSDSNQWKTYDTDPESGEYIDFDAHAELGKFREELKKRQCNKRCNV